MNESQYEDINSTLSGVAAVEPVLQVVEGHNQTVTPHMMTSGGTLAVGIPTSFNTMYLTICRRYSFESSLIDNYPILPTNITAGRNLKQATEETYY